jgi:hypothetical protein
MDHRGGKSPAKPEQAKGDKLEMRLASPSKAGQAFE